MGFEGLKVGQVDSGYWGHHTASIDWCEQNYTHSPYIAEFVNTLTNVPVIILGLYGAVATYRGGLPKRYSAGFLGLCAIGVGSFGFHASLKWEWQMMDELPMIFIISYSALLVYDTLPGFEHRFGIYGPIALVSWCIFVTLSYMWMPNPIYHQLAFGSILLATTGRSVYLLSHLKGHPLQKVISKTLINGIITFILGFIIWNVDNIFCDTLREGRGYLGMFGFLLEGHGYWHLMTGYGAYLMSAASIYLQVAEKVSPDAYSIDGESWFPVVRKKVPVTPPSRHGVTSDVVAEKQPLLAEQKPQ